MSRRLRTREASRSNERIYLEDNTPVNRLTLIVHRRGSTGVRACVCPPRYDIECCKLAAANFGASSFTVTDRFDTKMLQSHVVVSVVDDPRVR